MRRYRGSSVAFCAATGLTPHMFGQWYAALGGCLCGAVADDTKGMGSSLLPEGKVGVWGWVYRSMSKTMGLWGPSAKVYADTFEYPCAFLWDTCATF